MIIGWQTRTLGELCDVLDSKRRPITKSDRVAGEFPYYGATGILDYVKEYIFDERLVLIGEDGAKWGAGERTAFSAEGRYWVNNHAHVIRPRRNLVIDDWIIHYLNSTDQSLFITGLTVPKLNQAKMRDIPIPLPPLAEQRRIVTVLNEAFEGIATAVANAEKNLANARELFESYLSSVVGDSWASCEIVPLSAISTDITDGDHLPPPKAETGIPFVTIGNINKRTRVIDFADTFMVSQEYFDGLKANRKPRKGDVLYTVTGSFGIPVIVQDDTKFCFQRHIGLIRPKTETVSAWLYYLLLSPQVFRQANEGATGTAQKTVSLKVLRGLKVPKLAPSKQRCAVKVLDVLAEETARLQGIYQRKLASLTELKQAILHKAFTGELTAQSAEAVRQAAE